MDRQQPAYAKVNTMRTILDATGTTGFARAAAACTLACCLAAACTTERTPDEPPATATSGATPADTVLLSFSCGDAFRFSLRAEGPTATLFLPDSTMTLERTASAVGQRYSRAGVELWHDVHQATLGINQSVYDDCRLMDGADPWTEARLRGVSFRAIGQEPGWVLDILPGHRLNLIADYGARTIHAQAAPPLAQDGTLYYHATTDEHDLRVRLQPAQCADVMSGETFPWSVQVVLDGVTLAGCGRRLD
jgi:putative lipoprotein